MKQTLPVIQFPSARDFQTYQALQEEEKHPENQISPTGGRSFQLPLLGDVSQLTQSSTIVPDSYGIPQTKYNLPLHLPVIQYTLFSQNQNITSQLKEITAPPEQNADSPPQNDKTLTSEESVISPLPEQNATSPPPEQQLPSPLPEQKQLPSPPEQENLISPPKENATSPPQQNSNLPLKNNSTKTPKQNGILSKKRDQVQVPKESTAQNSCQDQALLQIQGTDMQPKQDSTLPLVKSKSVKFNDGESVNEPNLEEQKDVTIPSEKKQNIDTECKDKKEAPKKKKGKSPARDLNEVIDLTNQNKKSLADGNPENLQENQNFNLLQESADSQPMKQGKGGNLSQSKHIIQSAKQQKPKKEKQLSLIQPSSNNNQGQSKDVQIKTLIQDSVEINGDGKYFFQSRRTYFNRTPQLLNVPSKISDSIDFPSLKNCNFYEYSKNQNSNIESCFDTLIALCNNIMGCSFYNSREVFSIIYSLAMRKKIESLIPTENKLKFFEIDGAMGMIFNGEDLSPCGIELVCSKPNLPKNDDKIANQKDACIKISKFENLLTKKGFLLDYSTYDVFIIEVHLNIKSKKVQHFFAVKKTHTGDCFKYFPAQTIPKIKNEKIKDPQNLLQQLYRYDIRAIYNAVQINFYVVGELKDKSQNPSITAQKKLLEICMEKKVPDLTKCINQYMNITADNDPLNPAIQYREIAESQNQRNSSSCKRRSVSVLMSQKEEEVKIDEQINEINQIMEGERDDAQKKQQRNISDITSQIQKLTLKLQMLRSGLGEFKKQLRSKRQKLEEERKNEKILKQEIEQMQEKEERSGFFHMKPHTLSSPGKILLHQVQGHIQLLLQNIKELEDQSAIFEREKIENENLLEILKRHVNCQSKTSNPWQGLGSFSQISINKEEATQQKEGRKIKADYKKDQSQETIRNHLSSQHNPYQESSNKKRQSTLKDSIDKNNSQSSSKNLQKRKQSEKSSNVEDLEGQFHQKLLKQQKLSHPLQSTLNSGNYDFLRDSEREVFDSESLFNSANFSKSQEMNLLNTKGIPQIEIYKSSSWGDRNRGDKDYQNDEIDEEMSNDEIQNNSADVNQGEQEISQ